MAKEGSKVHWLRRGAQHIHDHFIPHARNNYVPHVLGHRVLAGYAVVLVLLKVFLVVGTLFLPAASLYSSAVTPANIVELTNKTRKALSLPALKVSPQLERAAQAKVEDMFVQQYFAHVSPEGVTPWRWIKGAGYQYRHAGENLAAHFSEAEDVQEAWLASASHKANIINPVYVNIGVAVARGDFNGHDTTFVVQMFGVPKPAQVAGVTDSEPENSPIVSTQVLPEKGTLAVAVKPAANVVNMALVTEETVLPLTRQGDDQWRANLDVDVFAGQQKVVVLTTEENGAQVISPFFEYAPNTTTQQMFSFGDEDKKSFTIFGRSVSGLEDRVREIYFGMILFLSIALLISVVLKYKVQRHSITAHALFVLVLAGVMALV